MSFTTEPMGFITISTRAREVVAPGSAAWAKVEEAVLSMLKF
jgi:hypothetical protein